MRFKIVLFSSLAVICLTAFVYAQVKDEMVYKVDMKLAWQAGRLELSMTFPDVFTQRHRTHQKTRSNT
ncbi:hypothetical protein ACFL2F_05260 [Myxococcota bacterium]